MVDWPGLWFRASVSRIGLLDVGDHAGFDYVGVDTGVEHCLDIGGSAFAGVVERAVRIKVGLRPAGCGPFAFQFGAGGEALLAIRRCFALAELSGQSGSVARRPCLR